MTRILGPGPRQRLLHSKREVTGIGQLTKTQQEFRDTLGRGRFARDPSVDQVHPTHHVRRDVDGTCDVVRLESTDGGYLDLGGKGAYDVAVGRPW